MAFYKIATKVQLFFEICKYFLQFLVKMAIFADIGKFLREKMLNFRIFYGFGKEMCKIAGNCNQSYRAMTSSVSSFL